MRASTYIFIILGLFLVEGCGIDEPNEGIEAELSSAKSNVTSDTYFGTYVTESYFKREAGLDWVSVTLHPMLDEQVLVQIRSRADKKKPTCTVDAVAYEKDSLTFYFSIRGKEVFMKIEEGKLFIDAKDTVNRDVLYYNCSGGGSLYGNYTKLNDQLSQEQVDQRLFTAYHSLQDIQFRVEAFRDSISKVLKVEPMGLSMDNQMQEMRYEGVIETSVVEDLNSDGYPELLFFIRDPESQKASVKGFSVNNGKSLSPFYFPPPENLPEQYKGYNGYDRFELVETSLVQRYPIFDNNGGESDSIKQLSFKLQEGESMRQFKLDNSSVFMK